MPRPTKHPSGRGQTLSLYLSPFHQQLLRHMALGSDGKSIPLARALACLLDTAAFAIGYSTRKGKGK